MEVSDSFAHDADDLLAQSTCVTTLVGAIPYLTQSTALGTVSVDVD